MKSRLIAGALGLGVLALAPTQGQAAAYSRAALQGLQAWDQPSQIGRAGATLAGRTDCAEDRIVRGGPHWRGGPRFYGRPGPYWGHRAWVRRPYYGTIVAGVVLGTIVTVAAVGMIPRRPAPDLCWYWADPYQNRGYWDYCY